jgi:hypothetical protein
MAVHPVIQKLQDELMVKQRKLIALLTPYFDRDVARLDATKTVPEHGPAWVDEEATLYWRGKPIRVFRHGAKRQRDIVEAFQRKGWVRWVDSPFTKESTLRQTVYDLNKTLPRGTIRFSCDGTGEGVRWNACPAE